MINTKLSICIPTYNRAEFLAETLDSFIPRVKPYNIPIYISNNNSMDDTLLVLKKYKEEYYEHIYYKSNKENLGAEKNIIEALLMSNTEYCWIFGDDDIIFGDVIDVLLENINKGFSLIVLNSSEYDKDLKILLKKKSIDINQDILYSNEKIELFISDLFDYTTFIGSLIVKKDLFLSVNFDDYKFKNFPHLFSIYTYVIGKEVIFINNVYIKIRTGNTTWVKDFFKVFEEDLKGTLNSLPDFYDNNLKNKILNSNVYFKNKKKIIFILSFKAKRIYNFTIFKNYFMYDSTISTIKKVVLFSISIIPSKLASSLINFRWILGKKLKFLKKNKKVSKIVNFINNL